MALQNIPRPWRGMMIWNIWEFELYGSYPKMEQITPLQGRGAGERVIQNKGHELNKF